MSFTQNFRYNQLETILQSCGVGDVIASSVGGRNRKCSEAFVSRIIKERISFDQVIRSSDAANSVAKLLWAELETEILQGQKLQGVATAKELVNCIQHFEKVLGRELLNSEFPLLWKIYKISIGQDDPRSLFCW